MLNVAYKIMAKVLQLKLQPQLMKIIDSNQTTTLLLWFILDNVFLINETSKKSNQPSVCVKLDFAKTYDKVSWIFIFEAMEKLGVPIEFLNLVKILFHDAKAVLCFNASITTSFNIHMGINQNYSLTYSHGNGLQEKNFQTPRHFLWNECGN